MWPRSNSSFARPGRRSGTCAERGRLRHAISHLTQASAHRSVLPCRRTKPSHRSGEIIMSTATNVVLVHGGFVDGSGWQAVYDLLKQDGINVSVVQNPTLSLEGDVA